MCHWHILTPESGAGNAQNANVLFVSCIYEQIIRGFRDEVSRNMQMMQDGGYVLKQKKLIWLVVCMLSAIVLAPFLLAGCGKSSTGAGEYESLADFCGKRIGVVTGAIQGQAIEKEIPTAQLCYYNSVPDLLAAVRLGKVDAFSASNQIIRYLMLDNEDLTYLDTPLTEPMDTGAIFPRTDKGQKLRSEFNEYLAKARDEGTLLSDIVHADLPATKGTIRLITAQYPPFIQAVEGFYSGYEIEILAMFCKDRGYALEIEEANFDGILASVQSGKALKRHLSGRTDGVCSCRA